MKINAIAGTANNLSAKKPAFQAVNQKYLKWAEKDYKAIKNIDTDWYESLREDVILFKDISKQDAIDTINACRKYVTTESIKAYETLMKNIKNA